MLPLDIVGLPEYEKLSEPERALCTELRLVIRKMHQKNHVGNIKTQVVAIGVR